MSALAFHSEGEKLHSFCSRTAALFAFTVVVGFCFPQFSAANDRLSVIVDPAFGGREHGPLIEEGVWGKTFTLDLGRKVMEELRKAGVAASLARTDDSYVAYDEFLLRAGGTGTQPRSYIVISSSSRSETCIRVMYPAPPRQAPAPKKTSPQDAVDVISQDRYWADSKSLATAVASSLRRKLPKVCLRTAGRQSFKVGASANLLPANFVAPVIVVEFDKDLAKVSESAGAGPTTPAAIASGVSDFLRSSR